jgi:hypothetical protein
LTNVIGQRRSLVQRPFDGTHKRLLAQLGAGGQKFGIVSSAMASERGQLGMARGKRGH